MSRFFRIPKLWERLRNRFLDSLRLWIAVRYRNHLQRKIHAPRSFIAIASPSPPSMSTVRPSRARWSDRAGWSSMGVTPRELESHVPIADLIMKADEPEDVFSVETAEAMEKALREIQ